MFQLSELSSRRVHAAIVGKFPVAESPVSKSA